MKFLSFSENEHKPAYYGTFSKKSSAVRPRNFLGKDEVITPFSENKTHLSHAPSVWTTTGTAMWSGRKRSRERTCPRSRTRSSFVLFAVCFYHFVYHCSSQKRRKRSKYVCDNVLFALLEFHGSCRRRTRREQIAATTISYDISFLSVCLCVSSLYLFG
jgi:hypothetical protein